MNYQTVKAPASGLSYDRASEFQTALLGIAAHDLRQPLQVIQSAYEWLGTLADTPAEKTRIQRGERAIEELTEQLDSLVGALRLYEYTQSMEVSEVALSSLFTRLWRENAEAADCKDIEFRVCNTSMRVISNKVLLDGIFRNLVRNAIKYTRPGGRIVIGCRRAGMNLRIDVYDTGVGMAPERLPAIFDAFQRLDSTTEDGLGLGLFVVRRAVKLLGHSIEVKSIPSRGSRFSVYARIAH